MAQIHPLQVYLIQRGIIQASGSAPRRVGWDFQTLSTPDFPQLALPANSLLFILRAAFAKN